MSLREHQITSSRFVEDDGDVVSRVSKSAKPSRGTTPTATYDMPDTNIRRMMGQAAVRTGIAILAVPDPLPFVDEVAGITLVAGGTYLIATS